MGIWVSLHQMASSLLLLAIFCLQVHLILSEEIDGLQSLLKWMTANGGSISSKIEFRNVFDAEDELSFETSTATPILGVVVKEFIPESETILKIPQDCVFRGGSKGEGDGGVICATAHALDDRYQCQHEDHQSSFYQPYLDFIRKQQHVLPHQWSDRAKGILQTIVGGELPSPLVDHSFTRNCDDGSETSAIKEHFYAWTMSKSWGGTLVPLYDLVRHRNGAWTNVDATWDQWEEDIKVYALRDIVPGEQLYLSFNNCSACNERLLYSEGTNKILMDRGYVQSYPQRWVWDTILGFDGDRQHWVFELDYARVPDFYTGEPTWHYQGKWFSGTASEDIPDLQIIHVLTSLWRSLKQRKEYVQESTQSLQNVRERDQLQRYYESLERALRYAIWSKYDLTLEKIALLAESYVEDDEQETEDGDGKPADAGGRTTTRYYDALEKRPSIVNINDYVLDVCNFENNGASVGHESIFEAKTHYQRIKFDHSAEKNDTCLWIEDIAHVCTSYRVFHESLIHYPASFLSEIKRVAYVGGGDSMILHEVLKYPSVELVVGLELDQQVVRASFRHFGTRPYFDDPRVEWWFGDATKSLRTLPPEYFGSFDLVLIDLTNDVADVLYVTPVISLVDAMAMLLKQPNGILSKQEDYTNRKITDFARYTVDLEYCEFPYVCRQSYTIGSNGINFLSGPQYDHKIDRLFLKESLEYKTRFRNWYNFRDNKPSLHNMTSLSHSVSGIVEDQSCQNDQSNDGILLVIEAEELSGSAKTKDDFVAALSQSLETHDMAVEWIDYFHLEVDAADGFSYLYLVGFFGKGYIVIRHWPAMNDNYVAIDLQLWNTIDKARSLKADILANLGGSEQTATSYRIVTGGVVQDTRKKDSRFCNGAQGYPTNPSEDPTAVTLEDTMDGSEVRSFIEVEGEMIVGLIASETPSVIVLCGSDDEKCTSLEALGDNHVVPLYSCDNLTEVQEDVLRCESSVMMTLRKSLSHKVNGVWIDTQASQTMASILLRLLTSISGQAEVLDEDNLIISAELTGEEWRDVFLERFLYEIYPFAPSKLAHTSLPDGTSFGIFSAGDDRFYARLVENLNELRRKTAVLVNIERVSSGHNAYIPDFNPTIFKSADYDTTKAYEQWLSQSSIGMQVLFQMNLEPPRTPLKVGEKVLYQFDDTAWLGLWVEAEVVRFYKSTETYKVRGRWGRRHVQVPRDKLRSLDRPNSFEFYVGARVIVHSHDDIWQQGFVESVLTGESKYRVWYNDADRTSEERRIDELVPEFDSAEADDELRSLSVPFLENVFNESLREVLGDHDMQQRETHDLSDGCTITAFWEGGNAILIWNGSRHIHINLYLNREDLDAVRLFQSKLQRKIPFLVLAAKDEQPRGFGRVVNFANDKLGQGKNLLWHTN